MRYHNWQWLRENGVRDFAKSSYRPGQTSLPCQPEPTLSGVHAWRHRPIAIQTGYDLPFKKQHHPACLGADYPLSCPLTTTFGPIADRELDKPARPPLRPPESS